MSKLVSLIIFVLLSSTVYCQVECGVINTNDKEGAAPYCGTLSSYRPDNSAIITKYIRVNIHIMQKANGTSNFQANNPSHIAYLESIIPDCNYRMRNLDQPYWGGPTGNSYIVDSKIQFVLKGIYFHQDDYGFLSSKYICDSYWYDTYKINEDAELNIFITNSPLITVNNSPNVGCGMGLNGESSNFVNTNMWY